MHLSRLQTGTTVEQTEHGGRSFRLVESKYKGQVNARSLVISGGPHAARVEAPTYRSASPRVFEIDPILVRPETGSDRLGKKLGLNLEAQLGDASLDARYYFETDTRPEVVKDLFSDPPLRGALLAVLAKYDAVIIGPPGGTVAGVTTKAPTQFSLRDAERVRVLEELAAALPDLRARAPGHPFTRVVLQVVAMMLCQAAVLAGIFTTTAAGSLDGPIILWPALIGIAAALLLIFSVLLLAFRRRANGFLPWLITSLVTLVSLPFLAVGLTNHLNAELDPNKPKRYEVTVLDYRPRIKKKQSGMLRVLGLPATVMALEPGGAVEIDPRWMPRPPCKRLSLEIGQGYFGNPWVAKSTCAGGW